MKDFNAIEEAKKTLTTGFESCSRLYADDLLDGGAGYYYKKTMMINRFLLNLIHEHETKRKKEANND